MVQTTEGFTWTPSKGVRHGLPSIGVVTPSTHFVNPKNDVFDAIVIGSGYAGLVAARDLAIQGESFFPFVIPDYHGHGFSRRIREEDAGHRGS